MTRLTIRCVTILSVGLWACGLAAQPPDQRPQRRDGGQRGQFRSPQHPLLTTFDTDKNGEISGAEMEKAPAALKQLDRNRDGKLTREELGTPMGRFGGPGRRGFGPGPGNETAAGSDRPMFQTSPLAKDDSEQKVLAVLKDMDQNQRRGMMNVPERDGRLLRLLTETAGAKTVVEIGTSNGYSGIWFCLALRKMGGRLITHEIDATRAGLARENFKRAGVDNLITLVQGDAHENVLKLKEPIDVLFLDADKEGYIDYLQKLAPLVRPGGLIIAHNMNERQADASFVKAITTDPNLETLFLHMDATGVGVAMKKR